jgi:hypothetical protein
MRGMLAQLSPNEEVALRRVALGFSHGVASDHIRRLKDLHLIEADRTSCVLPRWVNSGFHLCHGRRSWRAMERRMYSRQCCQSLRSNERVRIAEQIATRWTLDRPDGVTRACFELGVELP